MVRKSIQALTALVLSLVMAAAVAQVPADVDEYELPGDNVFPEGIVYHEDGESVFVGGAVSGALYRIDLASGDTETVLEPGTRPSFGTLGLAIDGDDLWIAGGGTGEILRMSISSGEIAATISTPSADATLMNDLIVGSNGDVFVTDSNRPTLFRVASGSDEAEAWLEFDGTPIEYGEGVNLNGIEITDDGAYLIVVHMGAGELFRIDIATQEIVQIDLGDAELTGGDGLVLDGTTLYVVQNGPDQVSVVELAEDFASGSLDRVLEDERLAAAATGALVGDDLLVTNAQFSAMEDGPELPFTVTVIPTAE